MVFNIWVCSMENLNFWFWGVVCFSLRLVLLQLHLLHLLVFRSQTIVDIFSMTEEGFEKDKTSVPFYCEN